MNVKLFLCRSEISGESNQSKKNQESALYSAFAWELEIIFTDWVNNLGHGPSSPQPLQPECVYSLDSDFLLAAGVTLSRNGIYLGWNRADLSWGSSFSPSLEPCVVLQTEWKRSEQETIPWCSINVGTEIKDLNCFFCCEINNICILWRIMINEPLKEHKIEIQISKWEPGRIKDWGVESG